MVFKSRDMKVQDLRIGNWIHHKYSEPNFIVSEINAFKTTHTINGIDIFDCEPIPITEEWLFKLGFCIDDNEDGFMKAYYMNDSDDSFYIAFDAIHNNFLIGATTYGQISIVKYIHQLQNLYYALTGEELKLKR